MTTKTSQWAPPGEGPLTRPPRDVAQVGAGSTLPAWLADGLTETVVLEPADASRRAAALCDLLEELCAAVEWLHDERHGVQEKRGLDYILQASRSHRRRMLAVCEAEQDGAVDDHDADSARQVGRDYLDSAWHEL